MGEKKMGRPTDNPKTVSFKTMLDNETNEKLKESSAKLDVSKAEIVRKGIHRIYDDLK